MKETRRPRRKRNIIIREPLRTGKELVDIKVTNMVGTFLNEDSNGLWIIRVPPTKMGPEKVYATVTTFFKKDNNGLRIISLNKCFNEILKQFRQMKLFKKYRFKSEQIIF